MAKWWKYIVNPLGAVVQDLTKDSKDGTLGAAVSGILNPGDTMVQALSKDKYHDIGDITNEGISNAYKYVTEGEGAEAISKLWNDITGQTAINQEFKNNMELAAYQSKLQEELYNKYSSPEAIVRQNEAAGLNPNLAYGSASSGQSNVPTYQAPSAIRNLSYSDKFAKALSMMTNVLGVKNLVYSTVANREAAQQSWLKTLQENERLNSMYRNNKVESGIVGEALRNYLFGRGKRYFRNTIVSTEPYALDYYTEAIRNERINKALQPGLYNQWEYGKYHSPLYGDLLEPVVLGEGIKPNAYWNNFNMQYAGQKRKFDFEWDDEYKTMLKGAGVAAPIIQTLLRILGGK